MMSTPVAAAFATLQSPSAAGFAAVPAAGALAGFLGMVVLGRRYRMSLSTTILCGIAGCAVGFTLLQPIPQLTGRGFPWLRLLLAAVVGTVAVMLVGHAVRRGWARAHPDLAHPDDVRALIDAGEGNRVEFTSSARWNAHTGARDERVELVVAKAVAAFLNADGGTLLIGVDDEGRILGLENDCQMVRQGDQDRYELWLHDLLGGCLGKPALSHVRVSFPHEQGRDLCRVDVSPATGPVFLHTPKGARTADFYLRIGNSTRQLLGDEALEYESAHWPRRRLPL